MCRQVATLTCLSKFPRLDSLAITICGSWAQLCAASARALERERRGQALLESISPGELSLRIRSIDSRGHIAVEGFTGYGIQRDLFRPWHAVHFGFEFDPSQLVHAVHVDWIKRNAEQGARPNSHERRV